ncbi:MAG: aminotransferase class I/II-fold pyridoxal phosphate-dependent enzyme [Boseongicola sp. SB0670_bin_30]|nr:aminotransferase class I/II-fold pyridoxal phosphate-dependent enzyme [Boseongicola sp. SB0670_bin_30]
MEVPERFANLPDYTLPRLRALLDSHVPGGEVVNLSIGEPRHAFPEFVGETISAHAEEFGRYPPNYGSPELLAAIAGWIERRFGVALAEDRLMVLNGTREGLFSASVALCPEEKGGRRPFVLIPNPFYQAYMTGALAAGADPVFLPATRETGFLPDLDAIDRGVLNRTAAFYICSPANPQGAVASRGYWQAILALAEEHDFRIFADECYSEIWRSERPVGALEAAAETGSDPERLFVFHSLSKRSNLPGLRSGFVAGGAKGIAEIRRLRSYAGAPLPGPIQRASALVWGDEEHVEASRLRYARKFEMADRILGGIEGYASPPAGFFLWLPVQDGEDAALRLWRETGVRVLPGAYLASGGNGANPGVGYIRVAMVADEPELERGLEELRVRLRM